MKERNWAKLLPIFLFLLLLTIPVNTQAKVRLNSRSKTILATQSFTLKVKGTRKKAKWKSSNTKVATVNGKGKVQGIGNGTATITAKVKKKKLTCKVTVRKPVTATALNIYKEDSRNIVIQNANVFKKISYTSSDPSVATVSESGKVLGIRPGYCVISINTDDVVTQTVKITVLDHTTYSTVNMMKGGHEKLTPPTYRNVEKGTYQVINPSRGYVKNGIYYATDYGFNTVIYSNDKYVHHFTIKAYCWEAHRGYHAVKAENTLDAIRAAKAAGANAVEIDIRATKDGRFVVMHDAKFTKNATLKGYIYKKTLKQIQKKPILRFKGKYYYVPTLEQALRLCKELNLNIGIEMKTLPSSNYDYSKGYLVKQMCDLIKKYGNEQTTVLLTDMTNARDFLQYSDGSIIGRIPNKNYRESESLRSLAGKYSYLMSTDQFAHLYYNDLHLCQDDPVR